MINSSLFFLVNYFYLVSNLSQFCCHTHWRRIWQFWSTGKHLRIWYLKAVKSTLWTTSHNFNCVYYCSAIYINHTPCSLQTVPYCSDNTENSLRVGFLTFYYFFIRYRCHNGICMSFLNIPMKFYWDTWYCHKNPCIKFTQLIHGLMVQCVK